MKKYANMNMIYSTPKTQVTKMSLSSQLLAVSPGDSMNVNTGIPTDEQW